jgi:transposase
VWEVGRDCGEIPEPRVRRGFGMSDRVYAGIDLAGGFHQVQLTSEAGRRVGSSFRIARGRRGVRELLAGVSKRAGEDSEVAFTIEATQNFWLELVHPLVREGHEVYLVSPSKSTALRKFLRQHTKTDMIDSEAISRLPAVDPALRRATVGDRRYDTLRRLARQSWQLRERMSARKRRIMTRVLMVYPGYEEVFRNRYCGSSLLFMRRYLDPGKARRLGRRRLGDLLRKRAWGKFSAEREEKLWAVIENAPELEIDVTDFQFLVNQDLDLLEAEERSQNAIRERMAEVYSEIDPDTRLLSVPGIGDFLAAAITAFVGEPGRFASGNEVVAFAGLCPRKNSSAGVDKPNQPLTQHGDPTLRSCLYVAAEIARHYDPEIAAFYQRLKRRGKHHKLAICALSAKLLRRCFAVLRSGSQYRVGQSEELTRAEQSGKTVRQSVSEVAELLNDESNGSSRPESTSVSEPTPPSLRREVRGRKPAISGAGGLISC